MNIYIELLQPLELVILSLTESVGPYKSVVKGCFIYLLKSNNIITVWNESEEISCDSET